MKFLMMMIPRGYQPSTPPSERIGEDFVPRLEDMVPMGKFNDDLAKAGTLLDVDGLAPITKGARVAFAGGKAIVTDGPFIESKEVIGGYWLIELNSKQEAVEWAQRCPAADGDVIEIRPIFEMPDFPPDADSPAVREQVEKQKNN
jgi:hypothetical protein